MRFHRSILMPRQAPSAPLKANGGASLVAMTSSPRKGVACSGTAVCDAPRPGSRPKAASTRTASSRPDHAGKSRRKRCSGGTACRDGMIDDQHHDRAYHRDDHTIEIEAANPLGAESIEDEA